MSEASAASSRPVIVVVGGGIAGLAAAWELVTGRQPGAPGAAPPRVHVVEASAQTGGKLRAAAFAGRSVDQAADAFLARRPEATDLCREAGLSAQLVAPGASGASIYARKRLRPMPSALNLGVPTRWWPLVRSGLLSPTESLSVARDLLIPHRGAGLGRPPVLGDRSVAAIVERRLGRPVVDRLVDPLIGGIFAGSVDDLSAAANFPVLIAADGLSGSLMHRLGTAQPAPSPSGGPSPNPMFWSLDGGMASLAVQLTERLSARGVSIHIETTVRSVDRLPDDATSGGNWRVTIQSGPSSHAGAGPTEIIADGVILATPAHQTARLLGPPAPEAADLLHGIESSSVAVVTLAVPSDAIGTPLVGTGFLVPRTTTFDGQPALMTGCTYLSRKWPQLASPGQELIRISAGRMGDDRPRQLDDAELTAAVFRQCAQVLGIRGGTGPTGNGLPPAWMVTRWDQAFPQYRVGHLIRVAKIEEHLARLPGLAVAGATYRGVGIPACVASGRAAARSVLESGTIPAR